MLKVTSKTPQGELALPKRGPLATFRRFRLLYIISLMGLLWIFVFKYVPMFGLVIAFQDYEPWRGVFNSEWLGFYQFERLFYSTYFVRLLRNTLVISFGKLVFGFPAPIIFALLLNEVRQMAYKRVVQTVTYMPHFLSWVVAGGFFITLLDPELGPVNMVMSQMGIEKVNFFMEPGFFRPILILTHVWKGFGWGSILYLAALAGVDPQLYESARMDGASKWQEIIYITIPALVPLMVLLLVLNLGKIMSEDFEQILMLMGRNAVLYEVGDVFETYVYREGLLMGKYSFGTAVGLFKNIVGLLLVVTVNWVAKRLGQEALW